MTKVGGLVFTSFVVRNAQIINPTPVPFERSQFGLAPVASGGEVINPQRKRQAPVLRSVFLLRRSMQC